MKRKEERDAADDGQGWQVSTLMTNFPKSP